MPYFKRDLESLLPQYARFPVIAILGPRQSGKSTLARSYFKNHSYINLEDLELRRLAKEDPKGFLRKLMLTEGIEGIILDEFQNCPELLSQIQVIVDEQKKPSYFVLTGSQNFLMNESISQSLAGRVGLLTLLPFSLHELQQSQLISRDKGVETPLYSGGYPRIFSDGLNSEIFYSSYIQTYVERDIRQIINIKNLGSFHQLLKLCAARVGQLLNISDLATAVGVSVPTVKEWLHLLESCYIIFLLRPHWENFNKRLTKSPKLYFYDTGIACQLLEISSPKMLLSHPYFGHLFENFIVADFKKQFSNMGKNSSFYFWRDQNGSIEIDVLIEKGIFKIPMEIKSTETFQPTLLKSLKAWSKMVAKERETYQEQEKGILIYGGLETISLDAGEICSWWDSHSLMQQLWGLE